MTKVTLTISLLSFSPPHDLCLLFIIVCAGVWPESESFKDDGMGPIPSKWKGICQDDSDQDLPCNRSINFPIFSPSSLLSSPFCYHKRIKVFLFVLGLLTSSSPLRSF